MPMSVLSKVIREHRGEAASKLLTNINVGSWHGTCCPHLAPGIILCVGVANRYKFGKPFGEKGGEAKWSFSRD